jgi:hypothetical protein
MQNHKTPRKRHRKKNLVCLEFGNDVLNTTPKAQTMKEKIDKLNFIKMKNFSVKDMSRK